MTTDILFIFLDIIQSSCKLSNTVQAQQQFLCILFFLVKLVASLLEQLVMQQMVSTGPRTVIAKNVPKMPDA